MYVTLIHLCNNDVGNLSGGVGYFEYVIAWHMKEEDGPYFILLFQYSVYNITSFAHVLSLHYMMRVEGWYAEPQVDFQYLCVPTCYISYFLITIASGK